MHVQSRKEKFRVCVSECSDVKTMWKGGLAACVLTSAHDGNECSA